MEGVLKFELPKDNAEFIAACHAKSTLLGVEEFNAWIRNELRFPQENVTEEEMVVLLRVQAKWNSIWDNRNSSFTSVFF